MGDIDVEEGAFSPSYSMTSFLSSLLAAHSLPAVGLLSCLLLWTSTHDAHLHGFDLLCGTVAAVLAVFYHLVRLLLILPRLWARWFH